MPGKPTIVDRVTHLWDPVYLHEWSRSYANQRSWRAIAVRQLAVFVLTARSIYNEEILLRAAALTYHTILSIVPMLAVGFALFKAFGGLQKLEGPLRQVVMENLAVGRAEEVGLWLDQFVKNVSAGAIAGVGVLLLFYSAVGLLTNVEQSINRIWGIQRGRSFFVRFAIYWCLVTLAPPLLGVSVSLSARLQSSAFAMTVLNWLPLGLGRWVLAVSSAMGVCVAFTLIYLMVPATKVRFKPALLGGVVAGVLWSISKYIFITISAGTLKYSAVYGALGVLPLLMLWIYASWIIVLFGATYAHANHTIRAEGLETDVPDLNPAQRELIAVRLAVAVATEFRAGRKPPGSDALATLIGAPLPLTRRLLSTLAAQEILVELPGADGEAGYLPARDLQELTVAQVLDALRQREGRRLRLADADLGRAPVAELLAEAERAADAVLRKADLRGLALRAEAGQAVVDGLAAEASPTPPPSAPSAPAS